MQKLTQRDDLSVSECRIITLETNRSQGEAVRLRKMTPQARSPGRRSYNSLGLVYY
jgi:hypothetical protein